MQMGKALAAMNFYNAAGAMRLSGMGGRPWAHAAPGASGNHSGGQVFGSMLCARVNHELTNALL